jgi:hypothetical protein
MSFNSIIFEDIKSNHTDYTFGLAYYKAFNVMYMKENSYINVTKLCQLAGKEYNSWGLFGDKDKIVQVFKDLSDGTSPFINISSGESTINGVYAHPDLAPIIASWVSVEFGLLVLKVIKANGNVKPCDLATLRHNEIMQSLNNILDCTR